MRSTYSVTEAQANLPKLLKQVQGGPIAIQRHNETVAFVISRTRMEAIAETLELLANPAAMEAIAKDQTGAGTYHPLSTLDDEG